MRSCSRLITVAAILTTVVVPACLRATADPVPVRHLEGVTFGFLVLRNLAGDALAYGEWKEVVTPGDPVVTAELQLHFNDGSVYEEITKFTQRGTFRLISDQVSQKGPSFKQQSESWLYAKTGKVMVRTFENGKAKETTKQLDIPADVANGMLFTLAKNLDPADKETDLSMVAVSDKPRVVKLQIVPRTEKSVSVGPLTYRAQHYVVHIKIPGVAGVAAPLIGEKPPTMHLWILKSEAPTFLEFEGPLFEGGPTWRIELAAPEPDRSSVSQK